METNTSILRSEATGSGAHRWLNCPGSVAMSHGLIEEEKKYATAGTEAHALAAQVLKGEKNLEDVKDEAVKFYVETIYKYCKGNEDSAALINTLTIVEERLFFLGSSGQIDCYSIQRDTAYLFDFKYGEGLKLRARNNPQLAFYACALKEKYPKIKKIHCLLIQPRVDDDIMEDIPYVDTWTMGYQTIRSWKNKFMIGLKDVEKAECVRAGSWCRFCKGRARCPVQFSYAQAHKEEQNSLPVQYMELATADKSSIIDANIINSIARVWANKDRIKKWLDSAEEFLLQMALKGVLVPGCEVGQKRSYRIWHTFMTKDEIAEELKKRGLEEPWEKDLMPLTRAEKLVDIQGLTEKPPGGPKLKIS